MRDTSEYLELFGRVDAVILINWHLYTLERQIQNGAKVCLILKWLYQYYGIDINLFYIFSARFDKLTGGSDWTWQFQETCHTCCWVLWYKTYFTLGKKHSKNRKISRKLNYDKPYQRFCGQSFQLTSWNPVLILNYWNSSMQQHVKGFGQFLYIIRKAFQKKSFKGEGVNLKT